MTDKFKNKPKHPEAFSDEQLAFLEKGLPLKCVARRHMRASDFMTYNAMYSCAQPHRETNSGALIFTAGTFWLANANNRNRQSEIAAMKRLKRDGWIIPVGYSERKSGHFAYFRWRILEHDEYLKEYPDSCPKAKYVDAQMSYALGLPKNAPLSTVAIPDALVEEAFVDAPLEGEALEAWNRLSRLDWKRIYKAAEEREAKRDEIRRQLRSAD